MPARVLTEVRCALDDLCAHVTTAAACFDAQNLDRDATVMALKAWTTIVHAGEAALAMAAARLAECGPPAAAGASSAADYVAKQSGITSNRAKETIKTGVGLCTHRSTREQAAAGRLSADQAAAITDAIAIAPDAEDDLLAIAEKASVGGLRDECAKTKAAHEDVGATERRIHANRCVRRYTDAEGAAHLHATGTKRDMARLDRALEPLVDEIFQQARAGSVRETHDAYLFDALKELGDRAVGANGVKLRYLGVLRIDWAALLRGCAADGETCEIAGLGPVSVSTAREMLGESILKLVVTKGVDVVNVTHLGRGPNAAQKIALLWQQPVCARQGCGRRARLEYDHKAGFEFARTRHTRVDETDPLCDPDHDLRTFHGWALVEGTGTRPMVPPADPRHPRNRRPPGDPPP